MNGQMNYQNQYPGQYPNQMPQQPMAPQPANPEKKKKLMKKLKWLGIFLVIFIVMFFGKRYIDFITYKYKPEINASLDKYYMSSNSEDLKPIRELLIKYKDNAKRVTEMQNYSYERIGEWFLYINKKYKCDNDNFNSCLAQLDEFKLLLDKLNLLYTIKGGGYYIISPNQYKSLKSEAEKKISTLSAVARSRSSYKNPENSETIYQERCSTAICKDTCSNGICKCTYYIKKDNGAKEPKEIECYKPETIKER
jgi:hypothetical protein